jgi:hypothetical protein
MDQDGPAGEPCSSAGLLRFSLLDPRHGGAADDPGHRLDLSSAQVCRAGLIRVDYPDSVRDLQAIALGSHRIIAFGVAADGSLLRPT